jgi:hypothetical protein
MDGNEQLGLTQAGTAALVGRSPRASRRWAAEEVPTAEAIVLQLLLDGKGDAGGRRSRP